MPYTRREWVQAVLAGWVAAVAGRRGRRDDTAFIQRCLDEGRPIPVDTYWIRGPVTLTHRHVDAVGSTYFYDPSSRGVAFDATPPWTGRFCDNAIAYAGPHWRMVRRRRRG